jgi:hypothetical protein
MGDSLSRVSVNARLIFFRSIISFFDSAADQCKVSITRTMMERRRVLEDGHLFTFHCKKFLRLLLPREMHPSNIPFPQHFNFEET